MNPQTTRLLMTAGIAFAALWDWSRTDAAGRRVGMLYRFWQDLESAGKTTAGELGRQAGLGNNQPGGPAPGSGASPAVSFAGNPNLAIQIVEWQAARSRNGENPKDWGAFRAHLAAIGAPDPGPTPVAGF